MTVPRRGWFASFSLAWVVVLVGACSSRPSTSADAGPEPAHALLLADPQAALNPFPDDRLVSNGALHTRPLYYQDYLPAVAITRQMGDFERGNDSSFESVTGSGNVSTTLIALSTTLDPTSLDGGAYFVVERDGGWVAGPPAVLTYQAFAVTPFLEVGPSLPLLGASAARLVLTSALHTSAGVALGRGFDYAAQVEANASIDAAALGIDPASVIYELPLQLQAATFDMETIAAWAAQDNPASYTLFLPDGGNDPVGIDGGPMLGVYYADDGGLTPFLPYLANSTTSALADDGGPNIADLGGLVLGTFASHDLRQTDLDAEGNTVGSSFNPAWVADPDSSPTVELRFVLVLPRGAPPYRVVVGAHGLGGRNTFDPTLAINAFCASLGELFTRTGFGCIGIDAIGHGTRGGLTDFFNFNELKSTRDSFRQTETDLLQLSRLLTQLDFDPTHPGPDLDAASAGYFGNSLGSIMGTVVMAVDHRLQFGVLNVPTGGVGTIIDSVNLHELVGIFVGGLTGIDYMSASYEQSLHLFESECQVVFEEADPFNFAALAARKHLLAQEGIGDKTLPNPNTDELFAAIGLPEITAPLQSTSGVSGFSRVDPAHYGITDPSFDPHGVFYAIPAPRHQAMTFLQSQGTIALPLEP